MTNPNERIFPQDVVSNLTKREYFAGLAMEGMLANPDQKRLYPDLDDYAFKATLMADKLIKALNKEVTK